MQYPAILSGETGMIASGRCHSEPGMPLSHKFKDGQKSSLHLKSYWLVYASFVKLCFKESGFALV